MNRFMSNNYFKVGYYVLLTLLLICILAFFPLSASAAVAAPHIIVDNSLVAPTNGDTVDYFLPAVTYTYGTDLFLTIQDGIDAAGDLETVMIMEGDYATSATITINKNITLMGQDPSDITKVNILPTALTGTDPVVISVTDSGTPLTLVTISDLTIDGTGSDVANGIYSESILAVSNVDIKNITNANVGSLIPEMGVYLKNSATIADVSMSNIGQYGIFIWEEVGETVVVGIDGFTYTGKGAGDHLDYGIEVAAGATCNIQNADIQSCTGVLLADGSTSSAILASTYSAPGTTVTVDSSSLTNNIINVAVGYDLTDDTEITVSNSDLTTIAGGKNLDSYSLRDLTFENNWWGSYLDSEIAAAISVASGTSIDYYPYIMTQGTSVLSYHFLDDITTSSGSLAPTFDSKTYAYDVTVPYADDTITITPSLIHSGADITVNTVAVPSDAPSDPIALSTGDNTITIEVTKLTDTSTYVLTVRRQASNQLTALTVEESSVALTLEPVFASGTFDYVAYVDNSATAVDISATEEDTGVATIVGTGVGLALSAAPADTVFTVTVTSSDAVTQDYTVTVKRFSSDATLSDIKFNTVTMQGFAPGTYTYAKTVDNSVDTGIFEITPNDSNATFTVNGNPLAASYPLTVGDNVFTISVTAQDLTATQDYTVTITRSTPVLNNAKLTSISIDGTPLAGFDPAVISYTLNVPAGTASVDILAVAQDPLASISGNGVNLLNSGGTQTLIGIEVTAQDGTTIKTYTLTVNKQTTSDATLSDLTVDGVTVTGFASDKLNYSQTVGDGVDSVIIGATANDGSATVSGKGLKNLVYGENIITVSVLASDGITQKDYTITITKSGGNSALLSDLLIDGVTIKHFDTNTFEYVIYRPSTKATVDISAVSIDSGATITGTGTKALVAGGNDFKVKVVSGDGTLVKKYYITIFRGFRRVVTLKNISIDGTKISNFDSSYYDYTVNVENSRKSITLWAETTDSYASVTGLGHKSLAVGTNKFTLTVKADDDVETKDYVVRIVRADVSSSSGSSGSSGSSDDSSSSDGSSSSSDADDEEDEDDEDNEQVIVEFPTIFIDVVEDILLKDSEKSIVGKTASIFIDEDAIIKAIKNVLSKKRVEEGDGSKGVKANPFISFPKANSVDDDKSVEVKITGNALKEVFRNEIGLIFTLDNFTLRILPNAFDPNAFEESIEKYSFYKKMLKNSENNKIIDMLSESEENVAGFEVKLNYETKSGGGGSIATLTEPAIVTIICEGDMLKAFEEVGNKDDIKLYIYNEDSSSLMALNYAYDPVNKTMKFESKGLGKFLLAQKAEQVVVTVAEPVVNEEPEETDKKPFPTFMVIIIIVAAILLIAIALLLIKKFRGNNDDDDENDFEF